MEGLAGLLVLLALVALAVPVALVWALVSLASLRQRVGLVESELARLRDRAAAATTHAPASTAEGPVIPAQAAAYSASTAQAAAAPPPQRSAPPPLPVAEPPPSPRPAQAGPPPASRPPRARPEAAVLRAIGRWFTAGNVPVKIGVLVMLAGVAAFLKYAAEQGLLVLPVELRLAAVAAAALGALGFAWHRRHSNRSFSLAVQGGAIGVLLLVVFAAVRLFGLIDPAAAFAISVLLVAGMGLLAVLQDARALAVLALLAGFLAPLWLSTGSGNHVALFSYYALLNAAVVAIAWFRAWRILNLLGFAFTFGITGAWSLATGGLEDRYASTQPFLVLFFLFYLAVPILFARRSPQGRRDLVEGSLVFGTPLLAFGLQALLLDRVLPDPRMALALCALGLGVLYASLAWVLLRRTGYTVLGQSHAILAVGFATLAVPLALSARATASVFALEGAGLVWLGLRQGRLLPRLGGIGLQLVAAGACLAVLGDASGDVTPVFNAAAMSLLLLAAGGWATAVAARMHGARNLAALAYIWAMGWWTLDVVHEVIRFVPGERQPDVLLIIAALTTAVAAGLHRRWPASVLALTVAVGLALATPLLLLQVAMHDHPLQGAWSVGAWLVFALAGIASLACLRGERGWIGHLAQFAWWLAWPLMLSFCGRWLAGHLDLGRGWRAALVALPWLALAAAALWRWSWLAAPRDGQALRPLRQPLLASLFVLIGLGWLGLLQLPAGSAPLPWLPLLNPVELAQLLALGVAAAWMWEHEAAAPLARMRVGALAAGGFVLLTVSTLRAVHHWGGAGWDGELVTSGLAQTSLTVLWSVLGVLGWIIGSRRGRRGLWLAGALLMGVVLLKLVVIDRAHLGNLPGIVSFLAYGVLCTIVGYLAPAPPRAAAGNVESSA